VFLQEGNYTIKRVGNIGARLHLLEMIEAVRTTVNSDELVLDSRTSQPPRHVDRLTIRHVGIGIGIAM